MPYRINVQTFGAPLRVMLFADMQRDYLNVDAVFSDETHNFVSNNEPAVGDFVTLKLRTGKDNADAVAVHFGSDPETADKMTPARKSASDGLFDFWTATVRIETKLHYYFSVMKDDAIYYYNKRGLYRDVEPLYHFRLFPDFKTPDWAKGAVMYQIFVDRFYNGDPSNDVVNNEYAYLGKAATRADKWGQPVAKEDICTFYGGDLQGVIDKMAYLRALGIEAIYFNPVFVSPSNHKYDIQDYDSIDPHYGVILNDENAPLEFEKFHNKYACMYRRRTTDPVNLAASNRLMAELIAIAHENGIKVILDGVFNHCGAFNKWLDKEGFYSQKGYPPGAYREETSPYNRYFKWYDKDWPNNDCYDSWWGHDNHPKLFFENSKELYQYILQVGAKWVSPPFNADGWRLDVAADLGYTKAFNHQFWRDFRQAVKTANPEALILAENYGNSEDWLQGDQWDTVMNYDAFMEPVTWFLTGMEKHSEAYNGDMFCNAMAFESAMRYHMARFSAQSLQTAMTQLSNHDHSRFLTRTNMTVGRLHTMGAEAADIGVNKGMMFAAVVFQMTWPGAPTVYYGDEAGLSGWTDPDNRRAYPWGKEDALLLAFHKEMIRLRKLYACLRTGSLDYLYNDYGVVSFGRWDKNERIIVVINNNNISKALTVPVWKAAVPLHATMERLIASTAKGFDSTREKADILDGQLRLTLPPYATAIYKELPENKND